MQHIQALNSISTSDILKQKDRVSGSSDFSNYLKSAINEVNSTQLEAESSIEDMAIGNVKDLHQAALAIGKAETNMKLMLEIRNKALSAYKDLSKTPM